MLGPGTAYVLWDFGLLGLSGAWGPHLRGLRSLGPLVVRSATFLAVQFGWTLDRLAWLWQRLGWLASQLLLIAYWLLDLIWGHRAEVVLCIRRALYVLWSTASSGARLVGKALVEARAVRGRGWCWRRCVGQERLVSLTSPVRYMALAQAGQHHAVGAGPGQIGYVGDVRPGPVGFCLLARSGEFDEVLLFGHLPGSRDQLALTTSADGTQLQWLVVRLVVGSFRFPLVPPAALDGLGQENRRPPIGVHGDLINWLCDVPDGGEQWWPSDMEMQALWQEAEGLKDMIDGLPEAQVAVAGAAVAAFPHVAALGGAVVAPRMAVAAPGLAVNRPGMAPAPVLPVAGLGVGAGGLEAPVGLGFPQPGYGGPPMNMNTMHTEIEKIRGELRRDRERSCPSEGKRGRAKKSDDKKDHHKKDRHKKDRDKKDRHKKEREKKEKKSKKKKKTKKSRKDSRSGSSGSSRSGTSSSYSSSSARSSSGSDRERYLRWKTKGRSRAIHPDEERKLETVKFKDKGSVLAFAAKHPGALSGFFLGLVHRRMSQGRMTHTSDLRKVPLTQWAQSYHGMSELRDQKEILTICAAMDSINQKQLEIAMDILSQRVVAIQRAKSKGGSWEKAEAIELVIGPTAGSAAGGLARLTA